MNTTQPTPLPKHAATRPEGYCRVCHKWVYRQVRNNVCQKCDERLVSMKERD